MYTNISLKDGNIYKKIDQDTKISRQNSFPLNNNFNENKNSLLKNNANDISFKRNFSNVDLALSTFKKEIGPKFIELFEASINQASETSPYLKYDKLKNVISIEQPTILQKNIEILKYPFTGLPLDIANVAIGTIAKIPGLKSVAKLQDASLLKKRRIEVENTANVSAIENYLLRHDQYLKSKTELEDKLSKATSDKDKKSIEKELKKLEKDLNDDISKNSLTGYDKTKGNYNTTAERSITRIVTGAIPAFFLANDAYNLSMYVSNDKKAAKEAKRKRFIQESIRILLTAGATFYGLKLYAKKSNASKNFNLILVSVVTLASEVFGRMIAGSPILPVSEEKAKKIAKKREKQRLQHEKSHNLKTKEPVTPKSEQKQTSTDKNDTSTNTKPVESIINTKNVLSLLGVLTLIGFSQEKIFGLTPVKNFVKNFTDKYNHFLTKEQVVKTDTFNELIKYLDNKDLSGMADKYRKIRDEIIIKNGNFTTDEIEKITPKRQLIIDEKIKQEIAAKSLKKENEKDKDKIEAIIERINKEITIKEVGISLGMKSQTEMMNLGRVTNKARKVIVDCLLLAPVKFAWAVINVPYQKVLKPLYSALFGKGKPDKELSLKKNLIAELLEDFQKMKNDPNKKFEDAFNKKILSSLNTETKSSISNADVGTLWRNIANAITGIFLIVDNFNLTMIESNGQDKGLAEQKAKERTIQRIAKLLYGAFTQQVFNTTFARTFNGSILGAEVVNSAQTTIAEVLERKTVGLPLVESNRQEIVKIEQQNLQATGAKGSFYRGMAKLTGKKALSERTEKRTA